MATINTASSNISLALHLSSQYQQNSESAFDQSGKFYFPFEEKKILIYKNLIKILIYLNLKILYIYI